MLVEGVRLAVQAVVLLDFGQRARHDDIPHDNFRLYTKMTICLIMMLEVTEFGSHLDLYHDYAQVLLNVTSPMRFSIFARLPRIMTIRKMHKILSMSCPKLYPLVDICAHRYPEVWFYASCSVSSNLCTAGIRSPHLFYLLP